MFLSSKAKVLAAFVVTVLVGSAAVAVFAGPGAGPTGEPGDPTATAEATDTIEPTETAEPTDELDPAATPDPTGTPDSNGDAGVPLDSPACTGDLDHPNPHDTDGDGDGCRIVETEDGMKNLPDPAADAHEGMPGEIGDQHRPPHSQTPGPPEGDPPYGNANGHDDEDATPTPAP